MRVLVCGGRDFGWFKGYEDDEKTKRIMDQKKFIRDKLSEFHSVHPFSILIEGEAKGVDQLAKQWANSLHVPVEAYYPDWSDGKKGGPVRNQRMLDEGKPDVVIAFPGHAGTRDMITRAEKAGVPVLEVPYDTFIGAADE